MTRNRTSAVIFSLTVLLLSLIAHGVVVAQQYEPSVGQAGKDVIWVPTPPELVSAMLDMAKVTPNDFLIDLGSGDGRIVIAAAKRGVRALGLEYNPDMVELSKSNAQKEGVAGKATFQRADIFATDFSKSTVLTMYLLPNLNMRLRPTILDMKPGTRVVSHAFNMEDWEPDQTKEVEGRTAYFWIVPAKVAGVWNCRIGQATADLSLSQKFQMIEGSIKMEGKELPLKNAKLEGDKISFSVGDNPGTMREYAGRVNGNAIEGTVKTGNQPGSRWTATHAATN